MIVIPHYETVEIDLVGVVRLGKINKNSSLRVKNITRRTNRKKRQAMKMVLRMMEKMEDGD